ncbi:MAG: DUF3486 family protein [Gammaproteobacteria bacterium]|nr:DUF3486 family protein [Gammaproteobacteria bacterium]
MPTKSSIKSLPKKIRDEVNRLLTEEEWTLDEIVAWLQGAGHGRSRSALGRHKKQLDKVAERLRRSRSMADALVRELGPGLAEGKTGRMLVEILQSLTFDFMMAQAEPGENGKEGYKSQDIFFLSKAMKEMAAAVKIEAEREIKLRETVAKEMIEKLDRAAEDAADAGEPGLSAARIDQLRKDFLGVRDAPA